MTSLNSQESSNDIGKLTDKQQAEYRNAYQEYIAQMAQLEMSGSSGERPTQPQPGQFMTSTSEDKNKDGGEPDGRKPYKRSCSKPSADINDFSSNSDGLDPIREEDEKGEHGSFKTPMTRKTSAERGGLFQGAADLKLKAGGGLRYQKLTSDDDESEESDNALLMKDGKKAEPKLPGGSLVLKGKDYLSDAMLDKKDSSDSGVRSNESSPNHSLQDEEAELPQLDQSNLIELDEESLTRKQEVPSSLSCLQDPIVARMSICSEDQCSLLASSPEESWPTSKTYNLNRTPSSVTLNNNTNTQHTNCQHHPAESSTSSNITTSSSGDDIISPKSSSTSTRPGPDNENVRVVHLKRGLKPGDPPEICTVSSDTVTFSEERESIL